MLNQHAKLSIAALIFAAFVLGACGPSTYQLKPTDLSPSATGEVKLQTESNENFKVELEVAHMAPPKNLGPSLSTYVVWVDPQESDQMVKAGQLKIDDESREGKMRFTTPYSSFDLLVTAEANKGVDSPSDKVVLRRTVKSSG